MTGLQPNVYAAIGATWAAALPAVILRIVARRMMGLRWWFDDYFCLSALLFASGYNIIVIIWTHEWGLGLNFDPDITEDAKDHILLNARLLMYCSQFCYAFSIASSKFAILSLYWRLFKMTSIRIPIQLMFAISLIWLILRTFMVTFHCIPVHRYWDHSVNGYCTISDSQFFFGTVLTHFVMDIIILTLPMIELTKLRLPTGQKIAVIGLFVIGAIVCLASIFVIIESFQYDIDTKQMNHDVALNFAWGAVEINMAIVSACAPLLRPVFRRILPRSFLHSYGRGHDSRPQDMRLNTIAVTQNKDADESGPSNLPHDVERALPSQSSDGADDRAISPVTSSGHAGSSTQVPDDMSIEFEPLKPVRSSRDSQGQN